MIPPVDVNSDEDHNLTLDMDSLPDDIEGGPYRPQPQDWVPRPPKPTQPLGFLPDPAAFILSGFIWLAFFIVSFMYWTGRAHPAVSANSIFVKGEWWRAFTALLTHSDLGHLLSNTPMFLVFGTLLRNYFGRWAFPIGSFVIGILTNLATIALHDNPDIWLVGASGMVYGMVGLWLVYYIKFESDYTWSVRTMRAFAFVLVVMWPSTYSPQISYAAHAIGFALGLTWGLLTKNFRSLSVRIPENVDLRDHDT